MTAKPFDRLIVETALDDAAAFFLAADAIARALLDDSNYVGDPYALRAISDAGMNGCARLSASFSGTPIPTI